MNGIVLKNPSKSDVEDWYKSAILVHGNQGRLVIMYDSQDWDYTQLSFPNAAAADKFLAETKDTPWECVANFDLSQPFEPYASQLMPEGLLYQEP